MGRAFALLAMELDWLMEPCQLLKYHFSDVLHFSADGTTRRFGEFINPSEIPTNVFGYVRRIFVLVQ